jgi:cytochrome b involved in lipid metabolism
MTLSPRIRALSLSLVMAGGVLLLPACSSDSSDSSDSSAATPSASTSVAPSAVASSAVASEQDDDDAAPAPAGNGAYTLAEVQQHGTSGDCWTAIDGKVYDLTNWEDKHPGGAERIASLCGTDGSAAFQAQHGSQEEPNETLLEYEIGTLS